MNTKADRVDDIDWDNLPPAHPVCEVQVEVPTLRLQSRGLGYPNRPPEFEDQQEIVVQWFGETRNDGFNKRNLQFAFPVTSKPDFVRWFGHPEWYRTVMLGPLKNWPNKEALKVMVREDRSPEKTALYVITSNLGLDDGHGGVIPSAFITWVVCLVDPTHGVISPREFANWEVPKEEVAKLAETRQNR